MGWNILEGTAWHDGGAGGFRPWAGYDPKERIGVVVLSNASTHAGVADIGIHLMNSKTPLADPEPPKQRTGRYRLTPTVVFEITRRRSPFRTRLGADRGQAIDLPKFELFPEGEKNFFAKVTDKQIAFETDPEGRAISLTVRQAGRPDIPGARLS